MNIQTGEDVYLYFQCLLSLQEYQGFWVHMAVCHLQIEERDNKEVEVVEEEEQGQPEMGEVT